MCGVPAHLLELLGIFYIQTAAVAYGDGALYYHCCLWVYLKNKVDDVLDVVGVEEVLLRVVVGGCCNDNEVGIAVCLAPVECRAQVEFFLGKVFLNVFVLNRRYAVVDFFYFFGDYINCYNFVVLCQQCGNAETYIACTCYCNFHDFICFCFIVPNLRILLVIARYLQEILQNGNRAVKFCCFFCPI